MTTSLFTKILYATDGSDNANEAADYALSLARDYNAHVTIVNVMPDLVEEMSATLGYDLAVHYDADKLKSFFKDNLDESKEAAVQRIHSLCDEVGSRLNGHRIKPDIVIRVGKPVEQILIEAKESECDLIIVGAKGHSIVDEILVGSVARGVMKKSHIPVLTIPLPKD